MDLSINLLFVQAASDEILIETQRLPSEFIGDTCRQPQCDRWQVTQYGPASTDWQPAEGFRLRDAICISYCSTERGRTGSPLLCSVEKQRAWQAVSNCHHRRVTSMMQVLLPWTTSEENATCCISPHSKLRAAKCVIMGMGRTWLVASAACHS